MRSLAPTSRLRSRDALTALWTLIALVSTCLLCTAGCEEPATAGDDGSSAMEYPTANGTDWTHSAEPETDPGTPCLDVDVESVDFGTLPVGDSRFATVELTSCGTGDVSVSNVYVAGDAGGFHVDCSLLVSGACPTAESPLVLPPEAIATLRLYFEPTSTSEADAADDLTAALEIISDAEDAVMEVPVEATAVASTCPVAVLTAPVDDHVEPGERVVLSAEESFSPNGEIVSYQWFLIAPTGVPTQLRASGSPAGDTSGAAEVELDVTLAGDYSVTLAVSDETGKSSCLSEAVKVRARPSSDLYAELVWDPAEGSHGMGGRDLDLHLLHPHADGPDRDGDGVAEGWFDSEWDCFWFTPDPGWAEQLSQSVDGWTPEKVHVPHPEDGAVYRLGVHYWDDHGHGPAAARLKLWVYGELVSDISGLTLAPGDLWEAATVHWPGGEVTLGASGGAFDVTADYPVPEHYLD